jgi:tetratricopeptide (TPR) repeat protein
MLKKILYFLFVLIPLLSFPKADSLLLQLKIAKDSAHVNTLVRLADEYMFIGKMDEAEKLLKEARQENHDLKCNSCEVFISLKTILYHYKKSEFQIAYEKCESLLPKAIALGDKNKIAECKMYLGMNRGRLGDFKQALDLYQESLPLAEATNNIPLQMRLYSNIAGVYFDQLDYKMAIDYFKKTLEMALKRKDLKIIGQSYNNIGSALHNLHKAAEAKIYYLKAADCNTRSGNKGNLGYNYMNLASCELESGTLEMARLYNKKAMAIFTGFKDPYSIASCLWTEGDIYTKEGNHKKAVATFEEAVRISESTGSPLIMERSYQQIASALEEAGDYKRSVQFYKKYLTVKDSIINDEIREGVTKKQLHFEFDKKHLADSLEAHAKQMILQGEVESNKRAVRQQKIISLISMGGLFIVCLLTFFIYRGFKRNQRANKLIEHQKTVLEVKNKAVTDSIYYARRIQRSLLPTEKYIEKHIEQLQNKKNKS